MIIDTDLKILKLQNRISCYFPFLPYYVNENGALKITRSRRRLAFWHFSVSFQAIQTIFTVITFKLAYDSISVSTIQKLFHFFYVVMDLYGAIFHIVAVTSKNSAISFYTGQLLLWERLTERFKVEKGKKKFDEYTFVLLLTLPSCIFPFGFLMIFFLTSKASRYPYRYISELAGVENAIYTFPICSLIELFRWYNTVTPIIFVFNNGTCYVYGILYWLDKLRESIRQNKQVDHDIILAFRSCHLLTNVLKEIYSPFMLPAFMIVFLVADVIVLYVCVAMHSVLSFQNYIFWPHLAIIFNGCIIIICAKSSLVFSIASDIAHFKSGKVTSKLSERYFTSMYPFNIKVGNFFHYQNTTLLTYFNTVIDNLVLLLTSL